VGSKGTSININDIHDGSCIRLYYSPSYELALLRIRLVKSDSNAKIDILPTYVEGYNVILSGSENPWGTLYLVPIKVVAEMFLGGLPLGPTTGIICGVFLLTGETVLELAEELSPPVFGSQSAGRYQEEAYVYSECQYEDHPRRPFDATLATTVEWSFLDPNNDQGHSLTVIAEAQYCRSDGFDPHTISTSVTLNMYTGYHYLDLHTLIEGPETTGVKVWVDGTAYQSPVSSLIISDGTHTIKVETPIYRNSMKYKFDRWLYSESTDNPLSIGIYSDLNLTAYYTKVYHQLKISIDSIPPNGGTTNPTPGVYSYVYGTNVQVSYTPNSGWVFTHWVLDGQCGSWENPTTVSMTSNHTLIAVFLSNPTGGGESCPILATWNGNYYADYCIIDIHNPTGKDVTREVPVPTEEVTVEDYTVKFRLREGWPKLNFSESVIDRVKLYAVDSYGNRYLCPLINATHSRLGNVWLQLLFSDEWKVQMLLLEKIDLTFIMPYQNVQRFIFVIEGCNQFKQ